MGSTDAEVDAAFSQCEQAPNVENCQRSWYERASPTHTVTLDGFWIDQTEVSVVQFRQFVTETGYETEAEREGWGWMWAETGWEHVDGADWQHPQ